MKRSLLSLILPSLMVFSCTSTLTNTESIQILNKKKLSGRVIFPSSFKVKSLDYSNQPIIISLLYLSKDTTPKVAIAGLGNTDGSFSLEPHVEFDPLKNEIFVLEATKRDELTNTILSLRTYVKWLDKGWESITTPNLLITSKTTALTIVQSNSNIEASNIISKLNINGDLSDTGLNVDDILMVDGLVNDVLSENVDPMYGVVYDKVNNKYSINNVINQSRAYCDSCDNLSGINLSSQDLSYKSLKNKNLSKSNLKNVNMLSIDLSNSNLSDSDLSSVYLMGGNLENANLSNVKLRLSNLGGVNGKNSILRSVSGELVNFDFSDFSGSDFSNSQLKISNFSYSNLENAKFVNTDLSNSNFIGANVTNVDFSGTNMSGVLWITGDRLDKVCAIGSIGVCN